MPEFSIIRCSEAAERFSLPPRSMNYLNDLERRHVLLCEGDWMLERSLTLDWPGWGNAAWLQSLGVAQLEGGPDIDGIAVIGDLLTSGRILNCNADGGPFLAVTGNLTAHALATGGATIYVDGNADIAEAVVSCYNHGELWVTGMVRTALWLQDHHCMSAGKLAALVRFDASDLDEDDYEEVMRTMPDGKPQWFTEQRLPPVLGEIVVPEVVFYADLWRRVCEDQPVIRRDAIERRPLV